MIRDLLPFVVAGIASGSVYALAALGLVVTYKTSGVFNFAHGAQAALGAYVMWELWQVKGWPWPLAIVAALLLIGVVGGAILERLTFALADKTAATRVCATVALLVSIQSLIVIRYTQSTVTMPSFLPTTTFSIGGVAVRYEQALVVVLAAAIALGLALFFRRARLGVAMQAVVDNPSLLGLVGTSPIEVRRASWVIGSCFATLSGILLAPTVGLEVTVLTLLVVQAFGAAAVGRFSELRLTYIGAIAVGVGQEVSKYLVTKPALADHLPQTVLLALPSNVPFFVLFIALVVSPRGKFVEPGAHVVRVDRTPAPIPRPLLLALLGLAAVGVVAAPDLVGSKLAAYTNALGLSIVLMSLFLLVRLSGQVSLCQMSFAAVGACVSAKAATAGLPIVVCIALGGLAAIPFGAFIAIPATRLSGVYLAIATFGFGILVERVIFSTDILFGEGGSVKAPRPGFATSDRAYFYFASALTVLCCVLALAVRRARAGRLLRGLAESPAALAAHGTNANIVRFLAFCLSAFIAAIGGSIIGPVTTVATPTQFSFGVSLSLIPVLILAGRRMLLAPFVAAALLGLMPIYVTDTDTLLYLQAAFGAGALIVTTGLADALFSRWKESARVNRRDPHRSPARRRTETRVVTA